MFTWGAVIFVGLWLVLRDVNAIVKAKLMGNPLLIHTIVIGSGLLIHGGSADGAMAAIVSGVCSALYVRGGLQAVLGKFQQAGYGQQAQSWIGTGQNMPIDAGALSQIFGQGQLGQIASQLGMSHDEAAGQLAQTLPDAVDRMTPEGAVPEGHNDLVNQVLSMLQQGRRPG